MFVKVDQRAPVAVFSIWYHVGSIDEPQGETGISHFLEHMMFRGTPSIGPGQLAQKVAAVGGSLNAFTSYDFTGYYEVLAVNHLPLAFQLESDRMEHLLLDPASIAKERQVVFEERRMRIDDDPTALANEQFEMMAIPNAYQRPIIGSVEDIQNISAQQLWQWYQTWYVPNNASLVIVGDVKPQQGSIIRNIPSLIPLP